MICYLLLITQPWRAAAGAQATTHKADGHNDWSNATLWETKANYIVVDSLGTIEAVTTVKYAAAKNWVTAFENFCSGRDGSNFSKVSIAPQSINSGCSLKLLWKKGLPLSWSLRINLFNLKLIIKFKEKNNEPD